MRSDESSISSDRRRDERGFGLIETLISITVLTTVALGVAQLFAISALANRTARAAFSYEELGRRGRPRVDAIRPSVRIGGSRTRR